MPNVQDGGSQTLRWQIRGLILTSFEKRGYIWSPTAWVFHVVMILHHDDHACPPWVASFQLLQKEDMSNIIIPFQLPFYQMIFPPLINLLHMRHRQSTIYFSLHSLYTYVHYVLLPWPSDELSYLSKPHQFDLTQNSSATEFHLQLRNGALGIRKCIFSMLLDTFGIRQRQDTCELLTATMHFLWLRSYYYSAELWDLRMTVSQPHHHGLRGILAFAMSVNLDWGVRRSITHEKVQCQLHDFCLQVASEEDA